MRFFKKIIIIGLFLFITDLIIGSLLRYYFRLQHQGIGYHTTYSINKTNEDILIFGSSRSQHAIKPKIIQDITGLSCYNVSQAGVGIAYSLGLQEMILERYQPKVIILEIFPVDLLNKSKKNLDVLSYLLPFYKDHPKIHSLIHKRGKYEKIKHFSKIYPFNSLFFQILYNNLFKINKHKYSKGYEPLHKILQKEKRATAFYENFSIDENNLDYLNDFIQNCLNNKIKVYCSYGPIYGKNGKNIIISNQLVREFCEENSITFLNFSEEPLLIDNSKYFNDTIHLNDTGATIYSRLLGLKIRELLNN